MDDSYISSYNMNLHCCYSLCCECNHEKKIKPETIYKPCDQKERDRKECDRKEDYLKRNDFQIDPDEVIVKRRMSEDRVRQEEDKLREEENIIRKKEDEYYALYVRNKHALFPRPTYYDLFPGRLDQDLLRKIGEDERRSEEDARRSLEDETRMKEDTYRLHELREKHMHKLGVHLILLEKLPLFHEDAHTKVEMIAYHQEAIRIQQTKIHELNHLLKQTFLSKQ